MTPVNFVSAPRGLVRRLLPASAGAVALAGLLVTAYAASATGVAAGGEARTANTVPVIAPPPERASAKAAEAAAGLNEKYGTNCIVCHGPDLKGVQSLGVNLLASKFVATRSAAELVEFLKVGRMPDDPATVTGQPMPGFGWLSEADLAEIAAFIKSRSGS